MEAEKNFSFVSLAFVAIAFACAIFGSYTAGMISAMAAGTSLLSWAATGHLIALIGLIKQKKNDAGIVLFVFMGFWICTGLSLIFVSHAELKALLTIIEPTLLAFLFLWQFRYRYEPNLRYVLIGLFVVVLWLFLSKFIPQLGTYTRWFVWVLGAWLLLEAYTLLPKLDPKEKH